MNKKHIIHLVSTLDKGAGVTTVVMNYFRVINKSKFHFTFLYFNESSNSYKDEIEALGGTIIKIEKPNLSFKYKKYLNEVFKSFTDEYEILHIHEVYLTFLFAPVAKKNTVKHVITHSHTTSYSDKIISSIRNRILCLRLKKHADHYYACSIKAGKFLYGKKTYNKGQVEIIHNAVDSDKFKYHPSYREKHRNLLNINDQFVIGHVGRYSNQKNHHFLIDIFNEMHKKDDKTKLLLVGSGPLKNDIENKIKTYKLSDSVIMLENRSDVNELLSAMDGFVMPSLFEGLPLVGIEAQCSGLPSYFSDRITEEVIFDDAKILELSKSASYWADNITLKKSNHRENGTQIISNAGYNIYEEVIKLENKYLLMK